MKKVLVTGGGGFIGSHVVQLLNRSGYQVVIADNFSSGSRNKLHPNTVYYDVDITTPAFTEVVATERPDAIVHHAAQIDVQYSLRNPVQDANVNILGTINLLEAAKKAGVKKVVYASSAAAYGDPQYLPIDERHPVAPLSFYGASKLAPEMYFKQYARLYGIEYVILRYANVYGIGQEVKGEGGVIAIFIDKFMKGMPVQVYGDGEQTRDFIYVNDVANANLHALMYGRNVTCNISCNKQTSVNDLVRALNQIAGTDHFPTYLDERQGDIKHSVLDNHAAWKELQWKPKYELFQGLMETYEHSARQSEN